MYWTKNVFVDISKTIMVLANRHRQSCLSVLLLVLLGAGQLPAQDIYGGGPYPQPRGLQPTYRAEDFIESLGLSAPLEEGFFELGIRYYRAAVWDTRRGRQDVPQRAGEMAAAWQKYGVRPMLLLDCLRDKPEEAVAMIKQYPPGLVAEIEGGNEVNNKFPPQVLNTKYQGKTDEAAGAAWMADFYKLLRQDPATKDLPVVAFTAIFTDYRLAKPHDAFDFANIHSYQGSGVPSSSLEMNITRFNHMLPVGGAIKPFVATECGYNVEEDKSNQAGLTGSVSAQAKSIPMLFCEYFRHGIRRTYLFNYNNADGYGLLASDQRSRRPSYYAVKNLVAALAEAKWNPTAKRWEGGKNFAPRALLFDLPDAPASVHTLSLQKENGEFSLLLWNEVQNFDQGAKRDLDDRPVPVTIALQTPVQSEATILTQNAEGGYDVNVVQTTGGRLRVNVPPSVTIVRLTPLDKTAPKPIAAPAHIAGEATENEVRLRWDPVPGAVGYCLLRNGWHIATVTQAPLEYLDQSSWLRPGLGYTYAVIAISADGAMSTPATAVVQTAARFPDLVVVDFGFQGETKAGTKLRAFAKLKNIGNGATPHRIACAATWLIDGHVIGWSTPTGPIQPGVERLLVSDGGPGGWTATDGVHLLTCVLDDINRLPGENKNNNVSDRTILVGPAPKGLLNGSSEAAPGSVNLTTEGTLDWVLWGVGGKDGLVRKANAKLIAATLQKTGTGYCDATVGCPVGMNWRDGEPTAEGANSHAGLWWNGVGTGHAFSAPADTTERVFRVYVAGIEGAAGTLTARLSDDSTPPYVSTRNGNATFPWAAVPGSFSTVYTIRYRAASPGQRLTVEWKLTGEANQFIGQARMQAATLAQAGTP
jgi:hypothetical protein